MLDQKFSSGDLRDGKGFLQFATSFKAEGSTKAQSQYMRDLDTKLAASATQTQIQVHCYTLLAIWQMIRGNDISEPEAFYHYLMESFPLEPESGKVVQLRGWVAEQITEESAALAQPTTFIAKICRHSINWGDNAECVFGRDLRKLFGSIPQRVTKNGARRKQRHKRLSAGSDSETELEEDAPQEGRTWQSAMHWKAMNLRKSNAKVSALPGRAHMLPHHTTYYHTTPHCTLFCV